MMMTKMKMMMKKIKLKTMGWMKREKLKLVFFLRTPFSLLKVVSNNICLGLKDCDQLH